MNIDEREQALLKLVQDWRDQECRRLLAEADTQASDMRRQAFARDRAALHQRVSAERARAQALVQAARAERDTRLRRRSEQRDAALVAAAWPALVAALQSRWAQAASRRRWVEHALADAATRLAGGGWLIRHAAGWPEAEQADAAAWLGQQRPGADAVRFSADAEIDAGLIISADGAVLDMSLSGLLRDRARIEARLLALAEQGGRHERS
ncbi:hypothetical protein F2Q65_10445 [Thiohalocapsa marina]|uniref:Uncharacterized protein n=1 Tax=Thiohalocapsa marina TaxID=424902 RepID=A0A5M8FLS0_9GAMM|nr:hypothetical protein [Thiohalocapsa marina]KAA6184950.1 hypothetical protein F2Q65_10445 [Thiohalocapsa marina]